MPVTSIGSITQMDTVLTVSSPNVHERGPFWVTAPITVCPVGVPGAPGVGRDSPEVLRPYFPKFT